MKKYDVTIGIPIFNSVDCIHNTLLSALSQSYPSIEFLLVDDACTDGTFEVVNNIIPTHDRGEDIHIISHQNNQGVSASRNQIIDKAQGEYLYFMDSDDLIADNTIELLMQNAQRFEAEIVFGSYERIDLAGNRTVFQYPSLQLLKADELACFAYRKYGGIQASSCNYLISTKLIRDNHLYFIDTNYWEDFVFTFDLVTLISRAVLLPNITYSYICRENSLSHYQKRERILKTEVANNIAAIDRLKKTTVSLSNKVYYPNRCFVIVLTNFFMACHILRHRRIIYPRFTYREIRAMMAHPATWKQIGSFVQIRFKNRCMYILGKMPSFICVLLILFVGRLKKLI